LVEAMCSGTMVMAHDSPHFRWLLGDAACVVDMTTPGALAKRLDALRRVRSNRDEATLRADSARQRFDWSVVKAAYVEMYRRLADVAPVTAGAREISAIESPIVAA